MGKAMSGNIKMRALATDGNLSLPQRSSRDEARQASLRYIDDSGPGYTRRLVRKVFRYYDSDGKILTDAEELQRIRSLAIPPAYTDVWISPYPHSHLQATGRDARGRKQYRYHAAWRATRDATKYHRMLAFGRALPKLRRRVQKDLARTTLCREKVLAVIVQLLETTLIRVGNHEYARDNQSYGLTTLRNRHVEIAGSRLLFRFRGKSKQHHEIALTDQRLARIIKRCRDLPGQELFQYIDSAGERHSVSSGDVNAYIQEIIGADFSAKDFRTWAGTLLTAQTLSTMATAATIGEAKKNINQALATVANLLGNTPAICRRCYVHPAILAAYVEQNLDKPPIHLVVSEDCAANSHGLSRNEKLLQHFLQHCAADTG
jgi:DNA topoisomerase-1